MNNNDIEEIKKINEYIRDWCNNLTDEDGYTIETLYEDSKEFVQAIENILGDKERLEKENKIYKEEYCKITKALDFKEGALNPEPSIAIEAIKKALIQGQAKANKYDRLVERIKENLDKRKQKYNEILNDYGNIDTDVIFNIPNANVRKRLDELSFEIVILQELIKEE